MSSASSAEPTAQQNFNPSWMRSTATANRGLSSGGGGRAGFDDGGDEHSAVTLSTPIVSEHSYTREELLALVPTGSVMPDALRDSLFFSENNLPLVSSTPLSELEQKLQPNINSSKAMSQLSASDRASIAAGAAYGSGYGGPGGALQNGQSPSRWTTKSSWSKTTPDRSLGSSTRGGAGGSAGRPSGSYFAGRGGGRMGGDNGYGGVNSTSGGAEDSGAAYQPKFSALRRGGGAGSVGRGGSTSGATFNTRADALYNPNDPTDRPKTISTAVTRSDSDDDDDGEGGWSKVGASRHSSTTASNSADRPAWARSESWIARSEQQRALAAQQAQNSPSAQQPAISHWNNRDADSSVWKDRNQMVASVKKSSTEQPPAPQQATPPAAPPAAPSTPPQPPQQQQQQEQPPIHDMPIQMPVVMPNSSTWSVGGGGGVFFPPIPQAPPLLVKEEPPVEFYYVDPTKMKRGPFMKDQMEAWFKAGYFSDESLKVQRGEEGEYKTIGELMKLHGATTPFDYPEDMKKASPPRPAPTSVMPGFPPVAANPMFPMSGMGMWSGMPQPDMYSMMQSTLEQQLMTERQRMMEEHQRRVAEEARKMAEFQENMIRQLTIQRELSTQQIREQELTLIRQREELERRDAELKMEALAKKEEMELKARQLEEQQAALEAEERRKRQVEERIRAEEQQRENAARAAADRARKAEEAAEREKIRLAEESRLAAEAIRQRNELILKEKEAKAREDEARRKSEERERLAREAADARARAEADAVWTQKPAVVTTSSTSVGKPKQVSPTGSDDSEGWTPASKEVKHTKAAPWAAKVEAPVKSEKTLLEIQLEEERQMKAEKEQIAKQKAQEQAANLGAAAAAAKDEKSWGGSKTWGVPDQGASSKSYVSPLFDGPSLEAANKVLLQKKVSQTKMAAPAAKPATPAKAKAAPKAAAPPPAAPQKKKTKAEVAADELEAWFIKRFNQAAPHVDAPTLYSCIMMLENPNEVEDICMSYMDESKTVKEFVREFIKRRIAMRAAGGVARPDDDLTSARTASAAPSDSNSGSNSNSGGQGKKKKKNTKAVFDSNILGFRGTAASDRLNKGEIDAIPTTPVNPSRR